MRAGFRGWSELDGSTLLKERVDLTQRTQRKSTEVTERPRLQYGEVFLASQTPLGMTSLVGAGLKTRHYFLVKMDLGIRQWTPLRMSTT